MEQLAIGLTFISIVYILLVSLKGYYLYQQNEGKDE